MRSGLLKERILILQRNTTINDLKETIETLTNYRSLRCGISYLKGSEVVSNHQLVNNYTMFFTIRYDKNVTESMVIRYDNEDYNIEYLEHFGKHTTKITAYKIK